MSVLPAETKETLAAGGVDWAKRNPNLIAGILGFGAMLFVFQQMMDGQRIAHHDAMQAVAAERTQSTRHLDQIIAAQRESATQIKELSTAIISLVTVAQEKLDEQENNEASILLLKARVNRLEARVYGAGVYDRMP